MNNTDIHIYLFIGETTLCGFWPPPLSPLQRPWGFRNSNFFRDGVISLTANTQPGGLEATLRMAPTL